MRKLQNARAAAFEFHDCLQLQLHVNVACCMLQQLPTAVSFHRHVHMRRRCPFKSASTEDSRSGMHMHVCLHLSDHEPELTLKLNVATGTCYLVCLATHCCRRR